MTRDRNPTDGEENFDDPNEPRGGDRSDAAGAKSDAVAALAREKEELLDQYQRALAETENLRKRHRREMADARQYAVAEFARELVDVVDNLERALTGVADDRKDDPLVAGVRLVQEQLAKALKNQGVTRIQAEGQPFDPMQHEAVQQEARDDVAPGTITRELMRGYKIGDRLLRAAMVMVAAGPTAASDPATPKQKEEEGP